ncbi:Type VI secretion system ATPase TssH [Sulfidibacter corallicola]|uniref:Type VI secretion system ATPase TssH n=1 Tax=Sulfidibacter corallicola TaxID=2818388 RepID=A0A8A4TNG4_SULCO|nr:type VI secretion system ATPase TssH [Sulfidibacter corallicola]QTD50967.1 type VI secretion system ATPase TssH [Sulfidibacter corallicola]
MNDSLQSLIQKTNGLCRAALTEAAESCHRETHYDIEVEHLLLQLLDRPESDLVLIARHFDVDPGEARHHAKSTLDRLTRGNTRTPAFSPHLIKLLREAWVLSSIWLGASRLRSATLLLALVEKPSLRGQLSGSPLLRLSPERLREAMPTLVANSAEQPDATETSDGTVATQDTGDTPLLARYTLDLTERARRGEIDEVVGRDREIRALTDVLMRRRQNNPILVGEAGVGKTAVVEGLARRIAAGDVPPPLRGVRLMMLDLGLLQAGAGVRGEFENRIKKLIAEIKASTTPIVLFVDEAHGLIGAGGREGQGDAANLIKPALARGELRTIAATTWSEYKQYFEKDAALTRRFQPIAIDEPDEATAIAMLRAAAPHFERHHGVHIRDEAIEQAVRLSHRYIAGRRLPDKAVSVLDTACARVALSQHAIPASLEETRAALTRLDHALARLEAETRLGRDHESRIETLRSERDALEAQERTGQARWQEEKRQVDRMLAWRRERNGEVEADEGRRVTVELAGIQGDHPMMSIDVDGEVVARVISSWTKIPLGNMRVDEVDRLLELEQTLARRVLGQDHALRQVARRLIAAKAGLTDPGKPTGVFLLLGPSGVGKTETALALAEAMFGGEHSLITVNMSEFQEAHTVAGLKGAPPGYVGYGRGGVLTEAVRRAPHSVVLLDEIEKAHPDVWELFFQVFDKGFMEDGEGVRIDFRNCIILLTANVGSGTIGRLCDAEHPDPEVLMEALRDELTQRFPAAFLGRLQTIPYYPLNDTLLRRIVIQKLDRLAARFQATHRAPLDYAPALVPFLMARCDRSESGARDIDRLIHESVLPELSVAILSQMAADASISGVQLAVEEDRVVPHFAETAVVTA